MNPATLLGVVLAVLGLGGYVIGVSMAFPGRAFSITAIIVGVSLIAVKSVFEEEVDER